MSVSGANSEESKKDRNNSDGIYEKYKRMQVYEHHFNTLETEIRKLASVWLLAALGAIAYLIKGLYLGDNDASKVIINAELLISIVGLMGTFGLLILWILDQMVYHRLLNSVFLMGLRMEFKHKELPPIRTLMVLFSQKHGMARYMKFYYLLPMFVLSFVSIFFSHSYAQAVEVFYPVSIGYGSLLIPVLVYIRSKTMEKYEEISQGFDDPEFVEYLFKKDFTRVLKYH